MILNNNGHYFTLTSSFVRKIHKLSNICHEECIFCKGDILQIAALLQSKGILIHNIEPYQLIMPVVSLLRKESYGYTTDEGDILLDLLTNDRENLKKATHLPFKLNINKSVRRGNIPSIHYLYRITCTKNNKVYIGQTTNFKNRFREHQRDLHSDKHDNTPLQKAWNYYGEEAFAFEVLDSCIDVKDIHRKEIDWIEFYKEQGLSFNILSGGYLDSYEIYLKRNGNKDLSLSSEEVNDIKRMLKEKIPHKTIAELHNIHKVTVSRISKRLIYNDTQPEKTKKTKRTIKPKTVPLAPKPIKREGFFLYTFGAIDPIFEQSQSAFISVRDGVLQYEKSFEHKQKNTIHDHFEEMIACVKALQWAVSQKEKEITLVIHETKLFQLLTKKLVPSEEFEKKSVAFIDQVQKQYHLLLSFEKANSQDPFCQKVSFLSQLL